MLPGHTSLRINPDFDARAKPWYEGALWNKDEQTAAGPLPLPAPLPPLQQYAVGLYVNSPVKAGLAEALIRKYDPRLAAQDRDAREDEQEDMVPQVPPPPASRAPADRAIRRPAMAGCAEAGHTHN